MCDLWELQRGGVRKEDGEGVRCPGDGDAFGKIYLEALDGAGLVEDDRLGADEAAAGVADGKSDGGDEGRLVKDDAVVGEGVVDAQMVAAGDELAVAVDAEVGDVVGGESAMWIESGGEVIDAKADVVGGAARVDDGALPSGQGLVEGEAGEAVAKADQGRWEDAAGGAVGGEAVPLGEDAGHEEGDEGGMKDEGGEGGPGIFVGIEIGNFLFLRTSILGCGRTRAIFGFDMRGTRAGASPARTLYDGADAIVALAELGMRKGDGVGVGEGDTFEGVLVEFVGTADDGVFKVVPDGGGAVERADDDAGGKDGEEEEEVPAGEDGEELEGVEDGCERAVARQSILLEPGGVAGGVVEDFAGGLNEIDAEQADGGDGGNEQDGGTHGTEPSPGSVYRVSKDVGERLAEAARAAIGPGVRRARTGASPARTLYDGCGCIVFGRGGGRDQSRACTLFVGWCCHDAF